VTISTYDALDRLTQTTFNDSSTMSYTYEVADRLTQIVDSANGTITGLVRVAAGRVPLWCAPLALRIVSDELLLVWRSAITFLHGPPT
jgi:YD repeat-containing protein